MVKYPKLEDALLKDVDQTYYYGASCGPCGHASRLDLNKLRAYLGPDFKLKDVRPRLKCEKCGNRQVIISYLTPDRKSSLSHLFGQPSK